MLFVKSSILEEHERIRKIRRRINRASGAAYLLVEIVQNALEFRDLWALVLILDDLILPGGQRRRRRRLGFTLALALA